MHFKPGSICDIEPGSICDIEPGLCHVGSSQFGPPILNHIEPGSHGMNKNNVNASFFEPVDCGYNTVDF